MSKSQKFFGHPALAAQIVGRLRRHFAEGDDQADASLVIGIFGEWGCGKSNLLELVHEAFDAVDEGQVGPPVVVVAFNPWRYEKEEHLLVPLLKTLELTIEQYLEDHQSFFAEADEIGARLGAGVKFAAIAALAFAAMFKGKAGVPGTDWAIEVDGGKALDSTVKLLGLDLGADEPSALAQLNSHYYQFERKLQSFTTGDNGFRLLFLIDDLDRCLPEKAVEMLESIKLFLDAPGCAFVLALDDEVVERGIVHRYRDYIFQGGMRRDQAHLAQLPITGAEYLEKIIHLPFRLPQPSRIEIRRFLLARYPMLFDDRPLEALAESDAAAFKPPGRSMSRQELPQQAGALLDLFENHIPPVPRKQIRTADLLLLLLDVARARGCEPRIKHLPLAKLTLLQLYAPEIYRFGRRRFLGFLQTLQEWSGETGWAQRDFAERMKNRLKSLAGEDSPAGDSRQQIEARNFDRFYAPLLEALEVCAQNRSGFDPFQFIKSHPLSTEDMQDIRCYFSLVDEIGLDSEERRQAAPPGEEVTLPVATLANLDEFLDQLFSASEGGWQSAVQQPELQGRVLDETTFDTLMRRLQRSDFAHLRQHAGWLRWLTPHLSQQQFERLLDLPDGLRKLLSEPLPEQPTEEQAKPLFAVTELLATLRSDQQAVLAEAIDARRSWLLRLMENPNRELKPRAEAGRLLGELGDPRPGVGVFKDETGKPRLFNGVKLPDIVWEDIPPGEFRMGTDGDEGYADEKPAHPVRVSAFKISRYPVTNAQFACFVEAGGYKDQRWWQEPPAALAWWNGEKADLSLLDDNPEGKKSYENWLAQEKTRCQPWFWEQRRWNNPNHPVVGVSWYEALAFCRWLNDSGQFPGTIRLPSEAEWEYAARGAGGWRYAWGNEADANLGNYRDTELERTSAVGLFPAGKAFEDQGIALYDMSGNVWEWTRSQWGKKIGSPDFTYKTWDDQETLRDDPNAHALRIIRGGSWDGDAGIVRCVVRGWGRPFRRDFSLGFRVVCVEVLPGSDC